MTNNANYPRWSPLFKDTNLSSLKNANTTFDGTTNATSVLTDFAIPIGSKFYAEILAKMGNYYYGIFGIAKETLNLSTYARNLADVYAIEMRTQNPSLWTINSISNTSVGSDSSDVGQTSLRVFGIAVNRVDNELKLYLDNVLKYTLSIPSTGVYHFMTSFTGGNNATSVRYHFNGGHDSTGAGDFTAGTSKDENGFGEFQFTPLSGHLACASSNLPTSTDIDAGGDDGADENPSKQFNVVTYTGDGNNNRSVSGVGFKPDLLWGKVRSGSDSSFIYDSSRGANVLRSDTTSAEANYSSYWSQFDSDGWTFGNNASSQNLSSATFVAWCWRAGGGVTSSNTDGSTTSTVQVNTKSKFSIVQWNGTGSATTIGHGLNAVPKWIIVKNRDTAKNWACYHVDDNNNGTKALLLNTGGVDTATSYWNSTQPTSSVFSVGGATEVNQSSNSMVAYCWANVDGMQRFGSFVGNGSSEPRFIYCGFRPRMLFTMRTDTTSGFRVRDTVRSPNNPTQKILWWTFDLQEFTNSAYNFDIVSNGFVVRTSSGDFNANGSTTVFGAWADQSAKYSNAF